MWESVLNWYEGNESVVAWTVGLSALTFVGSLIAVPIAVIQMRADYFVRSARVAAPRSPLQALRHLAKNALGVVLLVMGLAMLFLPGQGLLTLLLGVSLVDFPGKRRLQLRLVRLKGVRRSVAWMRRKANRRALEIPEEGT